MRRLEARPHRPLPRRLPGQRLRGRRPGDSHAGKPHALFLDLPSRSVTGLRRISFRVAVWQKPWKSQVLLASPEDTGFALATTIVRPADLGKLARAAAAGIFEGRIDRAALTVALFDAEAASVSRLQLLNGANAAAVRSRSECGRLCSSKRRGDQPGVWRLERPAARPTRHRRRDGGGRGSRRALRHAGRQGEIGRTSRRRDRPAAQLARRAVPARSFPTIPSPTSPRPAVCARACRLRRFICAAGRVRAAT